MITTLVSEALLCGSVGMTTCKVAVATFIAHNHTAKDGIYSHIRSVRHVATVSRTKLETSQQQLRATLDRHTNHPYLQQLVCTCTCECADNGPTGRPGNLQPPWPATDWHMTRVCMIEEETLRALKNKTLPKPQNKKPKPQNKSGCVFFVFNVQNPKTKSRNQIRHKFDIVFFSLFCKYGCP